MNIKYKYPYCGNGTKGKYRGQWDSSRVNLNSSYTYPYVFNNTVPKCSHIKIVIQIENTGSGSIYGLEWEFLVYRENYGWVGVETFILPEDGIYTVDCDIDGFNIVKIAFVPVGNPGSNRTWRSWYDVDELEITESVEINELTTGRFQYGVFIDQRGLVTNINEVYANIDGVLKPATDILVNVDDVLIHLEPVKSAHIITESEEMKVYSFIPPADGKYKIMGKHISGDHEIRLYDSDFLPMHEEYFYKESFTLTGGSLLYITVTHYFNRDGISESYL